MANGLSGLRKIGPIRGNKKVTEYENKLDWENLTTYETVKCHACGDSTYPIGEMGRYMWFRCRHCNHEQYGQSEVDY